MPKGNGDQVNNTGYHRVNLGRNAVNAERQW